MKFVLINTEDKFSGWDGEKVFDENGKVHECYGIQEAGVYFIRPDKYVGFRGGLRYRRLESIFEQIIFIPATPTT